MSTPHLSRTAETAPKLCAEFRHNEVYGAEPGNMHQPSGASGTLQRHLEPP
jgi:hypothetical protein